MDSKDNYKLPIISLCTDKSIIILVNMDKRRLLVSVILPNYNHSKYLDERIQSILNQTYTNYELIILDDCSTDDSRKIIERF